VGDRSLDIAYFYWLDVSLPERLVFQNLDKLLQLPSGFTIFGISIRRQRPDFIRRDLMAGRHYHVCAVLENRIG
jgi:hypothetical protein